MKITRKEEIKAELSVSEIKDLIRKEIESNGMYKVTSISFNTPVKDNQDGYHRGYTSSFEGATVHLKRRES
ncbi:hypothetical protein K4G99_24945, partial [Mycobacterium tuberculosis]|nr:hypothetical protein [Mycobacterium tuberculosis]